MQTATRAIIAKAIEVHSRGENGWGLRHAEAVASPKPGHEAALVYILRGLSEYADAHPEIGYKVAEDGYCGVYWLDIARATVKLLSGPMGNRLDGGEMDGMVREIAQLAGFDPDDI